MDSKNYITASAIGDYVYCPRGWWLKMKGISQTTPQMVRGAVYHEALLKKLDWSPRVKIIALLLIGIALLFIVLVIRGILGI